MSNTSSTNQMDLGELDLEWTQLILSARELGIKLDDIRAFLRSPSLPTQNVQIPTAL
ncbi:Anti-repressor SinI [compost metagenome]